MGDVWVKGSKELCVPCQEYVHLGDKRNHEQGKKHKANVQRKLDQAMLKIGVSKKSKIDVSKYGMGLKDTKWSEVSAPVVIPAQAPPVIREWQPVEPPARYQTKEQESFKIEEKVLKIDEPVNTNIQFKKRKIKTLRK